eukprot:jgi/Undpi1/11467/HiC_scaffold_30.g13764.m1
MFLAIAPTTATPPPATARAPTFCITSVNCAASTMLPFPCNGHRWATTTATITAIRFATAAAAAPGESRAAQGGPARDSYWYGHVEPSVVLGKLQEIVEDSAACGLVVGWPLSKSGRAEGQCLMVLQFLRQLHLKGKGLGIPVRSG